MGSYKDLLGAGGIQAACSWPRSSHHSEKGSDRREGHLAILFNHLQGHRIALLCLVVRTIYVPVASRAMYQEMCVRTFIVLPFIPEKKMKGEEANQIATDASIYKT